MARRVDEVEPPVPEGEGHGRGRDRDAALLLHLHEVRAGAPRLALGADLAGHLDRAAVEQELLGQRRLARVGVRDDREGAAAGDLRREGRGVVGAVEHGGGIGRGPARGKGDGASQGFVNRAGRSRGRGGGRFHAAHPCAWRPRRARGLRRQRGKREWRDGGRRVGHRGPWCAGARARCGGGAPVRSRRDGEPAAIGHCHLYGPDGGHGGVRRAQPSSSRRTWT